MPRGTSTAPTRGAEEHRAAGGPNTRPRLTATRSGLYCTTQAQEQQQHTTGFTSSQHTRAPPIAQALAGATTTTTRERRRTTPPSSQVKTAHADSPCATPVTSSKGWHPTQRNKERTGSTRRSRLESGRNFAGVVDQRERWISVCSCVHDGEKESTSNRGGIRPPRRRTNRSTRAGSLLPPRRAGEWLRRQRHPRSRRPSRESEHPLLPGCFQFQREDKGARAGLAGLLGPYGP